jgi:hypothetical protein
MTGQIDGCCATTYAVLGQLRNLLARMRVRGYFGFMESIRLLSASPLTGTLEAINYPYNR